MFNIPMYSACVHMYIKDFVEGGQRRHFSPVKYFVPRVSPDNELALSGFTVEVLLILFLKILHS